jgi:hypothetical protein
MRNISCKRVVEERFAQKERPVYVRIPMSVVP